MKKVVFTALVGLSLIGFTGCMSGIMGGKCMGSSKCESSGKCGDSTDEEKKCASSGKCDGSSTDEAEDSVVEE